MTGPRAFRSPAFRWLAAGSTINQFGSGIAPVALAFAVLHLHGGAGELGLVVGAYALAEVVAVAFGGYLGDRFRRTTLMRWSTGLAGVAQGIAAWALIDGWATIWLLGVVGAINGLLSALGGPASSAITPQTVPADALQSAITVRRLLVNIAIMAGSGVAGLIVAGAGAGWALAVDALTFFVGTACFAAIKVPDPERTHTEPLWAGIGEGAREVFRHTWLWVLIGQALVYHFFYGGAQGVLGPIVVGDRWGAKAWGASLSLLMAGFVVGGFVALVWRPRRALGVGTVMLALTAAFPLAMGISHQLWPVLVGAFLHGFGLELFSVGWDLSIQENVPEDKLSRVYSFDIIGSFVARPLGLALAGPIGGLVGYHAWLVVVAAVIVTSVALALLVPDVRHLERRDTEPATP